MKDVSVPITPLDTPLVLILESLKREEKEERKKKMKENCCCSIWLFFGLVLSNTPGSSPKEKEKEKLPKVQDAIGKTKEQIALGLFSLVFPIIRQLRMEKQIENKWLGREISNANKWRLGANKMNLQRARERERESNQGP